MRDLVFISYSHNDSDKAIFAEFKKNLDPAATRGLLSEWDDTQIKPGTEWAPQIGEALAKARVALLLVSPDYIASAFIREEELRVLLARAKRRQLSLYWVPVRDSLPEIVGLDQWQAAPGCDPKRPLNVMTPAEREQAIVHVCRKILDEMGRLPSISRTGREALMSRVAKTVGPQYQKLEEIGTGSSSIVYKAEGPYGRAVAIKALAAPRWEPSGQDDLRHRAALAQQLKHPAYIDLYEEFLDGDPCCVVTEYVDGISLDRYRESCSGPIAPRRVQRILLTLAQALAEAHDRKYLHEGLVPSNVHIDRITGRTRISAFRFLNVGPSTGMWGTFLINHENCTYLSPEQFDGCNRSPASDQYALGLLGFELLSGQPTEPVTKPADFVHRPKLFDRLHRWGPWADRAPALAGVLLRMLRVDPARRWRSMAEAARMLEEVTVEDPPHEKARRRVHGSYSTFQATDRADRLYKAFYASLFASLPEARQMFAHTDWPRQHDAINEALKLLLDCDTDLQDAADAAAEKVHSVARKHQQYGLGERELRAFEDALLHALASCGECEPEALEDWRTILRPGFQHMRDALCPRGPSRTAQDASRTAQDASRTAQDAPAKTTLGGRPGATATPAADARSASSDAL
jgi:serine/threonine protein kinase